MSNSLLRKAAVLVSSLDRDTADTLLGQMSDEQATMIRQMILGIDTVSDGEAHSAIEEFLHFDQTTGDSEGTYDQAALELRLPYPTQPASPPKNTVKKHLVDHLNQANDTLLVDLLRDEQPQTIAIVLSHVSAERASEVVAKIAVDKQADVLQRMVEADRLSTKLDESIVAEFETWLVSQLEAARQRAELVSRLSKIVGAAPEDTRQRILSNLAASDVSLSRDLGFEGEPITSDSARPANERQVANADYNC